ncbi:MAG: exosortase-dependent surface protein XDP2 [Phycisphaerales bacterium]
MNKTRAIAITAASIASASVFAAPTIYAAKTAGTASVLHGGDRELQTLAFTGTPSTMGGADFLRWKDGSLTNNSGTYGWNALIPRDVNGANVYTGNPDRSDSSTPLPTEAAKKGSLKDVFGSFNGYKNMSYIIDGEDNGSWCLDLLYAPGQLLSADANASTIELSVLERGGNSDFNIYGIRADGSLTSAMFVSRTKGGKVGWSLDTLEISGAQDVYGFGISLDSSWVNLKGIRLEAKSSFNGPDIVAVGSAVTVPGNDVPAPGALALVGLLGLGSSRRRRR